MDIRAAEPADYGEMFTLQLAAFVEEAQLYETPDVPALNDTVEAFNERLSTCSSWVALDQNRIIGAVSLRTYRGAPDVERLMVAPDRRGEGIATKLPKSLELAAIDAGHTSLQLVVGDLAIKNQLIYEHLGWQRTNSFYLEGYEGVLLHNMKKKLMLCV